MTSFPTCWSQLCPSTPTPLQHTYSQVMSHPQAEKKLCCPGKAESLGSSGLYTHTFSSSTSAKPPDCFPRHKAGLVIPQAFQRVGAPPSGRMMCCTWESDLNQSSVLRKAPQPRILQPLCSQGFFYTPKAQGPVVPMGGDPFSLQISRMLSFLGWVDSSASWDTPTSFSAALEALLVKWNSTFWVFLFINMGADPYSLGGLDIGAPRVAFPLICSLEFKKICPGLALSPDIIFIVLDVPVCPQGFEKFHGNPRERQGPEPLVLMLLMTRMTLQASQNG